MKIRPIYHRKEARVKAHVMICVLAYLLEKVFEKRLIQVKIDLSARCAMSDIRRIKAIEDRIEGYRIIRIPVANEQEMAILKAVGVEHLPKVLKVRSINS
ncbi:MAG: hypothetical protein AB1567_05860 [bacterium]